ncbi:short-chain dehydrogenase/reductase SDR [Paenibacillus algicola]|uniref:Short-chain dehydrogenase/reductase SDR n=1 Tax=Paenibacillus algicola TaxID=2565926 RepID=A0A4P8XH85_9BACL|nr:3-ketoacyl-ACP reductase [Paenibacillus algicola]QCT01872.1 short-chain dehydrogenase/reductase SDR [Paenibacillus algicola]
MSLKNKTAIITGAGKGIGRAMAIALASEGVHVGLIARTAEDLQSLSKLITEQYGVKAIGAAADISLQSEVEAAFAVISQELGAIDILINNAGIAQFGNLLEMETEEWKKIIDVNLMGTYHMLRTVLPSMMERGSGDVINISSTAGERGFATGSAYNASKFAVMGLTEAVLQEVRKHNIRVTALTPSTVNTELAVHAGLKIGDEDRMMQPEDVAALALAALKLPARVFVKTAGIWTTNPQ